MSRSYSFQACWVHEGFSTSVELRCGAGALRLAQTLERLGISVSITGIMRRGDRVSRVDHFEVRDGGLWQTWASEEDEEVTA